MQKNILIKTNIQAYFCDDFVSLDEIPTWAQSEKDEDKKEETSKIKKELFEDGTYIIDESLDLSSKVSIYQGDITKLEIDAIRSELGAKVDNLTKQLAESSVRHEELTNQLLKRLEEKMTAQTNMVQSTASAPKSEVKDKPKESGTKSTGGKKPWMNKSNYCNFCGGKKCKKGDKCDGNPGLYCMFCDMHGHAVTSAHFHGSKNQNRTRLLMTRLL